MKYKIIDGNGKTMQKGFRTKQGAKTFLTSLKIHKSEKLKIVEYETKN